jgi:hypothetical protein
MATATTPASGAPAPTFEESQQVLQAVRIASPCAVPWRTMTGDERVRFCSLCRKHVYNLAGTTTAEATALVVARDPSALCLRLIRRADGTVVTSDCPPDALRRRWLSGIGKLMVFVLGSGVASWILAKILKVPPRAEHNRNTETVGGGAF